MRKAGLIGYVLSVMVALPAAARPPPISGNVRAAPEFVPPPPARQTLPKRPVFIVAGMPVYVWAAVSPPNDDRADRSGAANAAYFGNEYPPPPATLF